MIVNQLGCHVTRHRPGQGEQQPEHHSAARAARWRRQNGPRSVVYSNVLVVVSVVVVVVVVRRATARTRMHASLICRRRLVLVGSSLVAHADLRSLVNLRLVPVCGDTVSLRR